MCGRYTIHTPLQVIADLFEVETGPALIPRYNVAPTQDVPVVRLDNEHRRELIMMRWGLVPYWAKDSKIGNMLINARAETVAEKPAYRDPFKRRRCLVVADGFFEWKKVDGKKQPYWIHLKSREPFAMAGLWDQWKSEEQSITSCTIVTTGANEFLMDLHDRMPVILPKESHNLWLDPQIRDQEALKKLLKPFDPSLMAAHPVSTLVNSAKSDDPSCVEPFDKPTQLVMRKL